MICIISYDAPHRKTQDLIWQLMLRGHKDIHVVATPWVSRKNFQPIFEHRPQKPFGISMQSLCEHLRIGITSVSPEGMELFLESMGFSHILIAGAGILPEKLPQRFKIINAHPGYLPNVRGLDALKWAILNGQPIGVTTHFISEKADEGLLIDRKVVPIYFEDTFHSVALRQYDMEIEMLADAIKKVETKEASMEDLANDKYEATRRMPHHLELKMMAAFEKARVSAPSRWMP